MTASQNHNGKQREEVRMRLLSNWLAVGSQRSRPVITFPPLGCRLLTTKPEPEVVSDAEKPTQILRRTRSIDRDRENIVRGLLLVAREVLEQTSTPAPLNTAARLVSAHMRGESEVLKRVGVRSLLQPPVIKVGKTANSSDLTSPSRDAIVGDRLENLSSGKPELLPPNRPSSPVENQRKSSSLDDGNMDKFETVYKVDEQHMQAIPSNSTPGRPRPQLHEASVPSTPIARAFGFGSLFTGLALGTIAEATKRATGFSSSSSGTSSWISDANADRLASTLCRMRGAALKLGQMLSIQDDTVLPAPLAAALERVRAGADRMPDYQLNAVLAKEFARTDWEEVFFESFDRQPVAAASLGQVHCAVTKDGRKVAIKVQYPGVAESIESDVANLRRLVRLTGIFPKGLFIDKILDVVGSELKDECDYAKEAQHQTEFRRLLASDPSFRVPYVVDELSTKKVLTMEYLAGLPLDRVAELPQSVRDRLGRMLLRLTLRELFEFAYVQSDPNFANYFYDPGSGKLCLLDFGATKRYAENFVNDYAELVWAASEGDRETLLRKSRDINLLNGKESNDMVEAHVQSAFDVAEPFSRRLGYKAYDFGTSQVSTKIARHGPTFLRDRLVPPPQEIYSLHRKLSGAYMACVKIKAKFPCRDLLEEAVKGRINKAKLAKSLAQTSQANVLNAARLEGVAVGDT